VKHLRSNAEVEEAFYVNSVEYLRKTHPEWYRGRSASGRRHQPRGCNHRWKFSGLRQGELLGLKWEDMDLEAGKLQVRRTLYKGNFTAPKTAKSRRTIKLTTRCLLSGSHAHNPLM
jgi:integrase